jgi:hypothetical protein
MVKQTEVEVIWKEAERRLGTNRGNFSLVRNSHYLQAEGKLEQPEQIFEVRWRGRGAGPSHPDLRITLNWKLLKEGILDEEEGDVGDLIQELTGCTMRKLGELEITGGRYRIEFGRLVNISRLFMSDHFEGMDGPYELRIRCFISPEKLCVEEEDEGSHGMRIKNGIEKVRM